MAETSLGAAELRFAELIWANAPVSSGALVGLANAFTRGKTLTREQQDTLQALIDEARRAL